MNTFKIFLFVVVMFFTGSLVVAQSSNPTAATVTQDGANVSISPVSGDVILNLPTGARLAIGESGITNKFYLDPFDEDIFQFWHDSEDADYRFYRGGTSEWFLGMDMSGTINRFSFVTTTGDTGVRLQIHGDESNPNENLRIAHSAGLIDISSRLPAGNTLFTLTTASAGSFVYCWNPASPTCYHDLGFSTSAPTTRPDTSALGEGDIYRDTDDGSSNYAKCEYMDGAWVKVAGAGACV